MLSITQLTRGPRHHVFGYIGHCRTIPWSGDGRHILCLEFADQDRMPGPADVAGVMLIDTQGGGLRQVDDTCGWNPQQGTMFYWNPAAPDTQFFFNDRDRATGEVFTVLYDLAQRRRVREYRFADVPVANGGVAQNGGAFLAINYGRLGRLRPVTGYPGAFDPTAAAGVPEDDGVFRVEIASGKRTLLCSFRRLFDHLAGLGVVARDDAAQMFINHTLWNRADDRILFFARSGAGWGAGGGKQLNCTFTMRPDGSELVYHGYVGGHPEWDAQGRIIAAGKDGLDLYDPQLKRMVGTLGSTAVFSDPKGDKALSADGTWLVHGNEVVEGGASCHRYVLWRMADGYHEVSPPFRRGAYIKGDLRLDASPCWNRDATQVLVPALADDGTRQLFVIQRRS